MEKSERKKREDAAAEDLKMVTHLTNLNIENFANDNNIMALTSNAAGKPLRK